MKFFLAFFIVAFITTDTLSEQVCGETYSYSANFEPVVYSCSSGYFLPAGATSCEICPNAHTCNGGTFEFSFIHTQGLQYGDILVQNSIGGCATNFGKNYQAVFVLTVYTCTPGYYLPANNDGCVICPVDNYCAGGTYTFNETTSQGITPCPAGTVAPTGMWELSQCGRTLHVGTSTIYLRTTKRTSPSLHIDINGDGKVDTADVVEVYVEMKKGLKGSAPDSDDTEFGY